MEAQLLWQSSYQTSAVAWHWSHLGLARDHLANAKHLKKCRIVSEKRSQS
jgi:hypothetical protein